MSGVPESICLKLPKCAERTQIGSMPPATTANATDSCGDCTAEKLPPRCQGVTTQQTSHPTQRQGVVEKGGENKDVAGVI